MRILLFRLVIATCLIGGLGGISPSAQESPSQPQQTFRSAVDVVTIQASVRDARGRVVSGLTSTDFEVRDNGQVRPILSLRSDRQSPLSLAILVDMSGSMGIGAKIAMARQAYRLDPDATASRSGRSRAVHVRHVTPRTSRFHARSRDAERRTDRFRALWHDVPLRRDRSGRAEAGGPVGHAQSHHRAHRRHRHEQRHDGA